MIFRRLRNFNLFLLLLVLVTGVSVAGAAVKFSGCTGKTAGMDCCEKKACCADGAVGHRAEAERGEAGCSHKGLCADTGLLPPAADNRFMVESADLNCLPALSPDFAQLLSLDADPSPLSMVKPVPEKYPPLYIRHCSFLS